MRDINFWEMPWPKTGATHYHAQLGLVDKCRAIKVCLVCNSWNLEPLDLLNIMVLGCYQPSPDRGMIRI